jgi:hypothetical protein
MSRRYITASEQEEIISRAQRRCEYCQCLMDYSSQSFVFDVKNIRRLLIMANLHPPTSYS